MLRFTEKGLRIFTADSKQLAPAISFDAEHTKKGGVQKKFYFTVSE